MLAMLFDKRLRLVRFVVSKVVGLQRLLNGFNSNSDFILIVGSAVLAQQVFENVRGNVFSAFDLMKQILTDDSSCGQSPATMDSHGTLR